ncbi:MAG: hypothetical protein ACI89J_003648 [Hyphomicrobiaceae bacterium]|jgi:hypothetical protein
MIERFARLPSWQRLILTYWLLNAVLVLALLVFAIR